MGNNLFLDDVTVTFPESIVLNNSSEHGLKFYPNPTSTTIAIETHAKGTILIHNISGQQMLQQEIRESTTKMDVSGWKSGIYVVKVVGEKGVQVGKFVKQ